MPERDGQPRAVCTCGAFQDLGNVLLPQEYGSVEHAASCELLAHGRAQLNRASAQRGRHSGRDSALEETLRYLRVSS